MKSEQPVKNPFISPFNETIKVEVSLDDVVLEIKTKMKDDPNAELIAHAVVGLLKKDSNKIGKLYSALNGRLGLNPKFFVGQEVYCSETVRLPYDSRKDKDLPDWIHITDLFKITHIDYFNDEAQVSINLDADTVVNRSVRLDYLSAEPFDRTKHSRSLAELNAAPTTDEDLS